MGDNKPPPKLDFNTIVAKLKAKDGSGLPFKDPWASTIDYTTLLEEKVDEAAQKSALLTTNLTDVKITAGQLKKSLDHVQNTIAASQNPLPTQFFKEITKLSSAFQELDGKLKAGAVTAEELAKVLTSMETDVKAADQSFLTQYLHAKIKEISTILGSLCKEIGMSTKECPIAEEDRGNLEQNFFKFKIFLCQILRELGRFQRALVVYCRDCHCVIIMLRKHTKKPEYNDHFLHLEALFPGVISLNDQLKTDEFKHFKETIRINDPTAFPVDRSKVPSLVLLGERKNESRTGGHACVRLAQLALQKKPKPQPKTIATPPTEPTQPAQNQSSQAKPSSGSIIQPSSTTQPQPAPQTPDDPNDLLPLVEASLLQKRRPRPTGRAQRPPPPPAGSPFQAEALKIRKSKRTIVQQNHAENRVFEGSPNFSLNIEFPDLHDFEYFDIDYYQCKIHQQKQEKLKRITLYTDRIKAMHARMRKPEREPLNVPAGSCIHYGVDKSVPIDLFVHDPIISQTKPKSFFSHLFEMDWDETLLCELLDTLPPIRFKIDLPEAETYIVDPDDPENFIPAPKIPVSHVPIPPAQEIKLSNKATAVKTASQKSLSSDSDKVIIPKTNKQILFHDSTSSKTSPKQTPFDTVKLQKTSAFNVIIPKTFTSPAPPTPGSSRTKKKSKKALVTPSEQATLEPVRTQKSSNSLTKESCNTNSTGISDAGFIKEAMAAHKLSDQDTINRNKASLKMLTKGP